MVRPVDDRDPHRGTPELAGGVSPPKPAPTMTTWGPCEAGIRFLQNLHATQPANHITRTIPIRVQLRSSKPDDVLGKNIDSRECSRPGRALRENSVVRRGIGNRLGLDPTMRLYRHIETLFRTGTASGLSDGQLLERFAQQRDEAAEAAFTCGGSPRSDGPARPPAGTRRRARRPGCIAGDVPGPGP